MFEEYSKKLEEGKNEDNDDEDDLSSDDEDAKQKKVKGKRTIKRKITNKKKKDNESLNQSYISNYSNDSEILEKNKTKQKLTEFKSKIKKNN